ncbi:MAG: hypothetical protein ABIR24_04790 [Verrucomicrobiota bacterium]
MQKPTDLKKIFLFLLFGFALVGCGKKTADPSEASLPELNRALQTVAMAKGKFPERVEDLTEFLALQKKRLPTPPPGKKLVIDSTNRIVVLVDQ